MIRALIFDCDGTLADTEPLHFRALNEALLGRGFSLTSAENQGMVGLPDEAALLAALRLRGADADPGSLAPLVEVKRASFRRSLAAGVVPVPGVVEFVRQAAETYVLAVATGAWREEVEGVLAGLGIRERFRAVVSIEDCAAGKPDPAPFLRALAALNASSPAPVPPIEARECLVIEDSPHGIAAARAAGMRSVGLTTTQTADSLRDADLVAPHYRALDLRRVAAFFDRRAR